MDTKGNKVIMGLDVSTACIGVCILVDDGSEYGKIVELTHISPKVEKNKEDIEKLFLKKRLFETFLKKYMGIGIDEVVIEEPLIMSQNAYTVATLLRFNGMISDCVYRNVGSCTTIYLKL